MFCWHFASIFYIPFAIMVFCGSNIGMLLNICRLKANKVKIINQKTVFPMTMVMRTWSIKIECALRGGHSQNLSQQQSQNQMHASVYSHG